jgi:hypothetical protein
LSIVALLRQPLGLSGSRAFDPFEGGANIRGANTDVVRSGSGPLLLSNDSRLLKGERRAGQAGGVFRWESGGSCAFMFCETRGTRSGPSTGFSAANLSIDSRRTLPASAVACVAAASGSWATGSANQGSRGACGMSMLGPDRNGFRPAKNSERSMSVVCIGKANRASWQVALCRFGCMRSEREEKGPRSQAETAVR